jgi:enoyl-CoA hydratase/carnithine racemase
MSTSYTSIAVEPDPEDGRITHVRLDAPERNNTIDSRLLREFTDAVVAADRDPEVRGVVLGATGDVFCAGASLQELTELTVEEGARWMTAYLEALELLRDTGKPVVAAVEGTCAAGGNELVSACDLIVAGESARFGQPEVGVGSTAAGGGAQLLPLIVGEKRARDLLLTGRMLEAEEARAIGLINRVVEDGTAGQRATALVGEILDRNSPQAYRTIKAVMKQWTNLGLSGGEMARDLTAHVWASEEFRERADAFLAREEQQPRPFTGTRPPAGASESGGEDGDGDRSGGE